MNTICIQRKITRPKMGSSDTEEQRLYGLCSEEMPAFPTLLVRRWWTLTAKKTRKLLISTTSVQRTRQNKNSRILTCICSQKEYFSSCYHALWPISLTSSVTRFCEIIACLKQISTSNSIFFYKNMMSISLFTTKLFPTVQLTSLSSTPFLLP